MTYIRTDNTNFIYKFNDDADYMQYDNIKGHIVKVASTIEELCDGVYIDINPKEFYITEVYDMQMYIHRKDRILNALELKIDVYGFVKTDKGLIYVAKMNENGELELI